MLSHWPTGKRIAFSAGLCIAIVLTFAAITQGLSSSMAMRVVQLVAIVVTATAVVGAVIGLIVAKLADYKDPESEEEFERLVIRSERLARENLAAEPDEGEFLE